MVAPTVSVLMAVYNTPPELLAQAVDSILAQTFSDFELVLLDDGSQDRETQAQLHRISRQDVRVRLCWEPHRGLTCTLNVGLHLAQGEFVARQDADDWSDPRRFELQAAYLRTHPELSVAGSATWMHQHNGQALWRTELPCSPEEIDAAFWIRNPIVHGAAMFRRSDALQAGGYREEFRCSQDYDFFWRLSEGRRGANLREALYHYRFTGGSISAGKAAEQATAHAAARILAMDRRRGTPENVARAFEQARRTTGTELALEAALKQADHMMLAGDYIAARQDYLSILRSNPTHARAWGKLIRLGIFQNIPPARKMCFR